MAINCPTHLLEARRRAASSSSSDRPGVRWPARAVPRARPGGPVNTYGRSKLAFEAALQAVVLNGGRAALLAILGPKRLADARSSRSSTQEERLAAGTPTDFFSDEVRSVVWVGDIVEVIIAAARRRHRGGERRVQHGWPANVTRVDVATAVATALGHPQELIVAVARSSLPAAANGWRRRPTFR